MHPRLQDGTDGAWRWGKEKVAREKWRIEWKKSGKDFRTFAVERVEKIEVGEEGFEIPADFNVSEYARGAFGIAGGKPEAVEIAFDAEIAGYIRERVWHESQGLEDGPGGSVVLRLNVAPGFELKAWIKGFLPHVRVLKPASLRDAIASDLEQARASFPAGKT